MMITLANSTCKRDGALESTGGAAREGRGRRCLVAEQVCDRALVVGRGVPAPVEQRLEVVQLVGKSRRVHHGDKAVERRDAREREPFLVRERKGERLSAAGATI